MESAYLCALLTKNLCLIKLINDFQLLHTYGMVWYGAVFWCGGVLYNCGSVLMSELLFKPVEERAEGGSIADMRLTEI